jgi:hypothetical protein
LGQTNNIFIFIHINPVLLLIKKEFLEVIFHIYVNELKVKDNDFKDNLKFYNKNRLEDLELTELIVDFLLKLAKSYII